MTEPPLNPWAMQDEAPQPIIAQPNQHVMRDSLAKYVASKIHPDVDGLRDTYKHIVITGTYDRGDPFRISPTEKNKTFNYERPTARLHEPDTLEISCFPGRDYMFHYASLIATHLSLTGRDPNMVHLQYPDADACYKFFMRSNLRRMGVVHTVVIGYVAQLCGDQTEWDTGPPEEKELLLFGWHKREDPADAGRDVFYLGCTTTIWGDIAGQLVLALRTFNQVKTIVYVGKGGSLWLQDMPNHLIATGEVSIMDNLNSGTWDALRVSMHPSAVNLQYGIQVNVPSPLVEDFQWLERWKSQARWVDCEVGYLSRACKGCMVAFEYFMVISDNVALGSGFGGNLTNEKNLIHLVPRQGLFKTLRQLLGLDAASQSHPTDRDGSERVVPNK